LAGSFVVIDKNNHIAPFSRDKLFISIYKSCGHRHVAISDASALVETIIQQLMLNYRQNRATLTKSDIYETTRAALQRFDQAAAVSYSAYHQL
jgi:transcriptional regulator NrdR family protein